MQHLLSYKLDFMLPYCFLLQLFNFKMLTKNLDIMSFYVVLINQNKNVYIYLNLICNE